MTIENFQTKMIGFFKVSLMEVLIISLLCFCPAGLMAAERAKNSKTANETTMHQSLEGDPFADNDEFSSYFDAVTRQNGSDQTSDGTLFQSDLHGYLEGRNRLRLTDGEWLSTRQRLWLEWDGALQPKTNDGGDAPYRFFLSGAVDIDPAADHLSDDTDSTRFYVEEGFITIDRPAWDLMIGQKIHRTGTGDGINPMDLVNPVDYRDPVANGRSDSRLPIPLAIASVQLPHKGTVQEAVLEAIFIPLARVNRFNADGSPWETRGLATLRQQTDEGLLILEGQQDPN